MRPLKLWLGGLYALSPGVHRNVKMPQQHELCAGKRQGLMTPSSPSPPKRLGEGKSCRMLQGSDERTPQKLTRDAYHGTLTCSASCAMVLKICSSVACVRVYLRQPSLIQAPSHCRNIMRERRTVDK